MAKKTPFAEAIIGKDRLDKIGTYTESTGGGTPLPKGEKLKDHPEAKRVQQPRDAEGKFTYNAVNAKPLKDGPSRGKTVPPFLRGVEMVWAVNAKTAIVYEGTVYIAGRDITAKEFADMFKEYKKDKGFGDIMKDISAKKGRHSKLEKTFLESGKTGTVAKEGEDVIRLGSDVLKKDFKGREKKTYKKEKEVFKETIKTTSVLEKTSVTDKTASESSEFDIDLLKSNPEKFTDKYGDELSEILSMDELKGVTTSQLLGVIASGAIKSVAHAKQLAKEFD